MVTRVDEIMESPVTVTPPTTVRALAELLLERHLDGVCVVDEAGGLIGVVTSMDLVVRNRRLHVPTVLTFMDLVIQLPAGNAAKEELRKVAATTVRDLMTTDVITVAPETPLQDAAAMMVDEHLTLLPVLDRGHLVGMVTKTALLRSALSR
jgi:CBS domain-containing protein